MENSGVLIAHPESLALLDSATSEAPTRKTRELAAPAAKLEATPVITVIECGESNLDGDTIVAVAEVEPSKTHTVSSTFDAKVWSETLDQADVFGTIGRSRSCDARVQTRASSAQAAAPLPRRSKSASLSLGSSASETSLEGARDASDHDKSSKLKETTNESSTIYTTKVEKVEQFDQNTSPIVSGRVQEDSITPPKVEPNVSVLDIFIEFGSLSTLLQHFDENDRFCVAVDDRTRKRCNASARNVSGCGRTPNEIRRLIDRLATVSISEINVLGTQLLLDNLAHYTLCKRSHRPKFIEKVWSSDDRLLVLLDSPHTAMGRVIGQRTIIKAETCSSDPKSKSFASVIEQHHGHEQISKKVQVNRDLKPGPTLFEAYYRNKRVPSLTVAAYIFEIASKNLTTTELKSGHVYVYWNKSNFGKRKIGYTTQPNPQRRTKEWERGCRNSVDPTYLSPRISHARRVESLIHAEFKDRRFCMVACKGCAKQRKHNEWFEVSESTQKRSLARWTAWIESGPYQEEGSLSAAGKASLVEVCEQIARESQAENIALRQQRSPRKAKVHARSEISRMLRRRTVSPAQGIVSQQ